MTKDEALKLALEALEGWGKGFPDNWGDLDTEAITAIKEALAQPEQEPVAWLITDEKINSLQVDSIQRLIDRAKHAHMTDIKLRINGQDEWHQADWLKHLTRTIPPAQPEQEPVGWFGYDQVTSIWFETNKGEDNSVPLYTSPPQRTWKNLTKTQINAIFCRNALKVDGGQSFARAIEAKLKEKNT